MSELQKKWQNILDRLRFWNEKDKKWQSAMNDFCSVIAPAEYPPMINSCYTQGFIDGFCGDNKSLKNDLEYWIYEVPMMNGEATVELPDGRKWNFKNEGEVIDYLMLNYPLKFKTL